MVIVDKACMPEGVQIELHDMTGTNRLQDYTGMTINFCTIAKKTFPAGVGWYAKRGEEFRSCIYSFGNYTPEMIKEDYEKLKSGENSLADLQDHFWNHDRDKFVLGLEE